MALPLFLLTVHMGLVVVAVAVTQEFGLEGGFLVSRGVSLGGAFEL